MKPGIGTFVAQLVGLTLGVIALVVGASFLQPRQHLTVAAPQPPDNGYWLDVEVVATDLRAPWSLAFLPDGRTLLTERPGRVRLIDAAGKMADEPVLVIDDILADTKLGLMGLALDPDFATDPFVYLAYGYRDGEAKRVRVARYRWTGSELVEQQTLLEGIPAQFNHSGGRLRFGPDKMLYITTGDADQPPNAQDLRSLSGKILRIDRDGSIPTDNPFVGRADARPEIYSYGHRNPQGLDFQRASGKLLSTEHGPNGGDELNWVEPGKNYGWPTISHDATHDGMQAPPVQFTPSIAPASGTFYNSDLFPQLEGNYLVGCLRGEALLRVELDAQGNPTLIERWLYARYGRIRDVVVAPDGAIWLTSSMFDPPEAHGREGYDQLLRVTPAEAGASGAILDIPVGLPPQIELGNTPEQHYSALCASCHGANLQGGLSVPLVGLPWKNVETPEDLLRIISDGLPDRGMPGARPLIHDDGCRRLADWIWEQHEKAK